MLLDGLPPESLTMTALRVKNAGAGGVAETTEEVEPGDGPWSHLEMLVAQLTDAVRENTWAVMQVNTDQEVPKPEPLPRPGVKKTPDRPRREPADPRLVEWLRRRQNGEDTTDLDAELNITNVTPLRPMTKPGGGDGGHGTRRQP